MQCPYCTNVVPSNVLQCPFCGAPVPQIEEPTPQPPVEQKSFEQQPIVVQYVPQVPPTAEEPEAEDDTGCLSCLIFIILWVLYFVFFR